MQQLLPDSILKSFPFLPCVALESSLRGRAREWITRAGLQDKQLCVVCDANTRGFAQQIRNELSDVAHVLLLDGTPHADDATVALIRAQPWDALVAVGSGTISDLCKYASFLERKSYVVFPTAPSMNGYLSANASITQHGQKLTLPAHLPEGVFCDLGVLASAPHRLIVSGLGDSLCRSTSQADWLLSHLLLDTAYDTRPFDWLLPYEQELYTHADKLISADENIIRILMLTLLVSGLGMVLAGGSYPASQGEHLIAHTMEMLHGNSLTYHGEQIGVTTLTMARIQQDCLSRPMTPVMHNAEQAYKNILHCFGENTAASIWQAYEPKITPAALEQIKTRLTTSEREIRERISLVTVPVKNLEAVLARAGAPRTAHDLGWSENDYQHAIQHARFIRNRFTFLDLI